MPAHIAVRPPARPSESAQIVRDLFDGKARLVRRDPLPRQYRKVINWGNSAPIPLNPQVRVFNDPPFVRLATDKLLTFQALKAAEVSVPEFRTSLSEVEHGTVWLARTLLSASSGRGIVVLRPGDAIPSAPLYVRYVRKRREFRVHVANGETIFVQEKKRRLDSNRSPDQNLIRNHDNGWVYTLTEGVEVPESIKTEAVKAVRAVGLDFGAVDIVLGRRDNQPYVLEINTAPGLKSPTAIAAYRAAFTRMLDDN